MSPLHALPAALIPQPPFCLPVQVRSGEPVENSEILRFAQLFNDELTLDNLERVQLVSICQVGGKGGRRMRACSYIGIVLGSAQRLPKSV